MKPLEGKTALVTGGGVGSGRTITERLAADGAAVAIHFDPRDEKEAHRCASAIREAGGQAFAIGADLASLDEIAAMFEILDASFATLGGPCHLDILVSSASELKLARIEHVLPESFDRQIAVNMRAPFFVTQHALKRMGSGGRIIFISTASIPVVYSPAAVYAMAKAAMLPLCVSLAQLLAERGITVNAVLPTFTEEARNACAETNAFARLGEPEEIAGVVAFLASDSSRWVTGQAIEASGGELS